MSGNYPRYLTYKAGELEDALTALGATPEAASALKAPGGGRSIGRSNGRSALLRNHSCQVTFPDGTEGRCSYTRGGLSWHLFRFEHTGRDGRMTVLPTRYLTTSLENTRTAIEKVAGEQAEGAFLAAILREQKDWFRRAKSSAGILSPVAPQMKAGKAKELAGRYALCQRVGTTLLPVSATVETMAEAIDAWKARRAERLVIACCCRFRRRWEEPRFNPLFADPEYPTQYQFPSPTEQKADHRQEELP